MSYLLDTNIVSELRRKAANEGVLEWFEQRSAATLYLSVLSLGELRKGVQTLTDAKRRRALLDWLEVELPNFFAGRVLAVDAEVADRWGRLMAQAGRSLSAVDSLIGATAAHHGLSVVTRNVRDFADLGVEVINPWTR